MIKIADLAARLAEKHGIAHEEAERFLTQMIAVMNDSLRAEKQLKIKGLGTFKVVSVNARESVDVNTGERIMIEGREKVSFTPEASMRDLVNKPFAQFETVVIQDGVDFDSIDENIANTESTEDTENIENIENTVSTDNTKINENTKNNINNDMDSNTDKEKQAPASRKFFQKKKKDEPVDESQLFDEYGYYLGPEDDNESRLTKLVQNQKVIKFLMTVAATLIGAMFLGMCYMYYDIKHRNERIDEFVAKLNASPGENAGQTIDERMDKVREAGSDRFFAHERKVDSLKQLMMTPDSNYVEAVNVATTKYAKQGERRAIESQAEEAKRKQRERIMAEKERHADAARMDEISRKAAMARQLEGYNADERVRTGAYVITGIDRVVTVQKGQTLASISRTWLGAGMECYVEAVNGGIKSVEAGQDLKIPSLKAKKHHSRN